MMKDFNNPQLRKAMSLSNGSRKKLKELALLLSETRII